LRLPNHRILEALSRFGAVSARAPALVFKLLAVSTRLLAMSIGSQRANTQSAGLAPAVLARAQPQTHCAPRSMVIASREFTSREFS
jgi:hypothetical protein